MEKISDLTKVEKISDLTEVSDLSQYTSSTPQTGLFTETYETVGADSTQGPVNTLGDSSFLQPVKVGDGVTVLPVSPITGSQVLKPNANNLAIQIPSTVNKDTIRCDAKGDPYAEAMFKTGSGHYDKLEKSFGNIQKICNQALKNKKIDVSTVKSELKDAMKKAASQSKACENRRAELQRQYDLTSDIFNTAIK